MKFHKLLYLLIALLPYGCGGGGGDASPDIIQTSPNAAPIAHAGGDQAVSTGTLVTLDGSASSDTNGDPITYLWSIASQPSGSSSALNNSTNVNPTITIDEEGTYTLSLTVNDGQLSSTADQVTVTATNANIAPVADAGDNQQITTSAIVQLDGLGSFDSNSDPLTYSWILSSKPSGSTATLFNSTSHDPTFTADLVGNYDVSLIVNDGLLDSSPNSVTIEYIETNTTPVARAGNDRTVSSPVVQLDGSGSDDPDGDALSFLWSLISRPIGSGASLSSNTAIQPTFTADIAGSYVWRLLVDDGELSSNDTVSINYTQANNPPIADAGSDQDVSTGTLVTLDGSASSDTNGDPITYLWSIVSRPAGSSATLNNTTVVSPTITTDIEGTYTLSLTVNDGLVDSSADQITVTATDASGSTIESFDGSGALTGFVTNNPDSLPDVTQTDGRYRANLTDNTSNITLHFNDEQGRLDAWLTRLPFEFIARNIGIGTQADSQQAHPYTTGAFNFAGIQVHVPDLESKNSSHMVVGHRGSSDSFTIEGKNTLDGSSNQGDLGSNVVPDTRADLRVVGNSDGTLTFYWQLPNPSLGVQADNWSLYGGTGQVPGTAPDYGSAGSAIYVGLITYAYNIHGIPFVGTCDSIELIEN